MFLLENDQLVIAVASKGAELKSVLHKDFGIEYLWGADPAYWAKTSPVLFPIVGALKNNTYSYKGIDYTLPRHGFARDKEFKLVDQQNASLTLSIESDSDTLAMYPFPFIFSILYTLTKDELKVAYRVQNTGNDTMFFSVGGHPAFKVPLVDVTSYEDYRLVFEARETVSHWPISSDGLIETNPKPLLDESAVLPLSKALFAKDALVLKHLKSHFVQLTSDKTPHGLQFSFTGFPYLGLWATPGADFLCIEPWCGIADSVNSDQQLEHKEGIRHLPAGNVFNVEWKVQFH